MSSVTIGSTVISKVYETGGTLAPSTDDCLLVMRKDKSASGSYPVDGLIELLQEELDEKGEENVIEEVRVNGTALEATDKAVDIDLTAYATEDYVTEAVDGLASLDAVKEYIASLGHATEDGLGELEARVTAIESDNATGTELSALDSRVSAIEADNATGTGLAALDARVTAIESDNATGTELSALDSRVSAIEADNATGTGLAALEARVAAIESDNATGTELSALDSRVSAVESCYASETYAEGLVTAAASSAIEALFS